jgi:putative toxin-antitoxin system antitoxin component (TIGR02293 family)
LGNLLVYYEQVGTTTASGDDMTVADVVEWLGGRKVLRTEVRSELELVRAVQEGLPTASIAAMVERGALDPQEVERFIIPRRTLAHRRKRRQPLSPEESDRLARAAHLLALATETFGDQEKAARWMRRPNRALRGAVPIELLTTSGGARLVEDVLERIAHGVFS